jgi:hypothetical protein
MSQDIAGPALCHESALADSTRKVRRGHASQVLFPLIPYILRVRHSQWDRWNIQDGSSVLSLVRGFDRMDSVCVPEYAIPGSDLLHRDHSLVELEVRVGLVRELLRATERRAREIGAVNVKGPVVRCEVHLSRDSDLRFDRTETRRTISTTGSIHGSSACPSLPEEGPQHHIRRAFLDGWEYLQCTFVRTSMG